MLPKVLKNFNLFVDGRNFAGRVDDLVLPKLTLKTQEHRAGGMDAPVELDMGMNKLECNFTLCEYDPDVITFFGIRDGSQIKVVMRGAIDDDNLNNVVPVVVTLGGTWREVDFGNWKAGEKATLKVAVALRYYKLEIGERELAEIDIENMVRKIDGEDRLTSIRDAINFSS